PKRQAQWTGQHFFTALLAVRRNTSSPKRSILVEEFLESGTRNNLAANYKGSFPGKFSSGRRRRTHENRRKSQVVSTARWSLDIPRQAFCSLCGIPWPHGSQTDLGGPLFSRRNDRRQACHAMVEWPRSRLRRQDDRRL